MTDDDDLVARVGRVVDGMLARGCPCRYPRFRASCERDSKDLGAPGYSTWDQSILVAQFQQKVPRNVISDGPRLRRGQCAVCGANYVHTIEEYFRDAWIERLEIKPVLSEIGAPLYAALPRCCPFYAAGPHGRDDELHLLDLHYPQLSTSEWVAWLVEEAT